MEDMLYNSASDVAEALGRLLDEHKAVDVRVLDLSPLHAWTDFFVIASASSSIHMEGLQRHVKDFVKEAGLDILYGHKKGPRDDIWQLVDLGNIVVHLMTAEARDFYDLERLWAGADILYPKP